MNTADTYSEINPIDVLELKKGKYIAKSKTLICTLNTYFFKNTAIK